MFGEKGIAPLVSGILYTVISISAVGLVLTIGVPYLKSLEDVSAINKARSTMAALDQEILRIASSGQGSSSTINLALKGMDLSISSKNGIIKVDKDTKANIIKRRFRKDFGNFFLCSNCRVSAYKASTARGEALILENEHIRLEVSRHDSNTPNILLSGIVKEVRFIDSNEAFDGNFNFYPDAFSVQASTVSTRLVREGAMLGEGEIIAYVGSPYYAYDLHFNLQSGADWFGVYISDMNYL